MTEQTTPPIDPRFDPLFQRGYADSPSHAADQRWGLGVASAVGHRPAQAEPAQAQPAQEQLTQPAQAQAQATQSPPAPAPPAAVPAAPVVTAAALGDEPVTRTSLRNPFVYVLAGASILLFVSAVVILVRAAEMQTTGVVAQQDMLIQQLSWSLAPPMLNGGVIGIVAVLIYLAFAWQRESTRR